MYEETLTKIGLSPKEAQIYELLVNVGPSNIKSVLFHTKLKRGNAYYLLDNLESKDLIVHEVKNGRTLFTAKNPEQLELLLAKQKTQLAQAQEELHTQLPQLRSLFQSASVKPGVKFYEGIEGIKTVLEDTLISNPDKQLATFSDLAGYVKFLGEWNKTYYAPKRKKLGVFERAIVPNNPLAKKYIEGYVANELTENVFLDYDKFPFKTEVNIYNNKVSFVSFNETMPVAVLIENPDIYTTLLSVFDALWAQSKK